MNGQYSTEVLKINEQNTPQIDSQNIQNIPQNQNIDSTIKNSIIEDVTIERSSQRCLVIVLNVVSFVFIIFGIVVLFSNAPLPLGIILICVFGVFLVIFNIIINTAEFLKIEANSRKIINYLEKVLCLKWTKSEIKIDEIQIAYIRFEERSRRGSHQTYYYISADFIAILKDGTKSTIIEDYNFEKEKEKIIDIKELLKKYMKFNETNSFYLIEGVEYQTPFFVPQIPDEINSQAQPDINNQGDLVQSNAYVYAQPVGDNPPPPANQ